MRHRTHIRSAEDLGQAVVADRAGAPILLRDVAEVVVGSPPPIGDAVINDGPGLLLIVEKQPWGNTLEVTREVEAALEALRPGLEGVELDPTIFRPATFIELSLENLGRAMAIGCLLVVLILVAFLYDWRTALVSTIAIPLSLLGMLVLLHVEFQSVRLTLLIFLSIPFATIGGIGGAYAGGGVLSIGSLIGFVTVLGIAARNGIMLVSHYRHLEEREGMAFGDALLLRGAEERLSPILMTASSAALALLPLAVSGNLPGHEIEYPMALVILGGLFTSTVLNLFFLPALYGAFGRAAPESREEKQAG